MFNMILMSLSSCKKIHLCFSRPVQAGCVPWLFLLEHFIRSLLQQTCSPLFCPLPPVVHRHLIHAYIKPDPPSWLQLPSLMSADKLLVCMLRFFGDNWLALLVCRHVSLTHFWRSIALQSDELAHVFCPLWPPPTHAPRVIKHRNGSTMSELVPTPARGTTLLPAQI